MRRREGAAMVVSEDFARLTDPFRPELLAHCYRMLGSVHDAEDQVQETMIRAWRSYGEFEGRASLPTWLYPVATNACPRALENTSRPPFPSRLCRPGEYPEAPPDAARLDKYATASQNADIPAVLQLLRDDAVFEMPPEPTWFTGRKLIARFLQTRVLSEPGRFQMIPTAANGQPALAAYLRDHDGVYRAHSICVLTIAASRVARVTSFNDPGLFPAFGLPEAAPAAATAQVPGR